MLYLLLFWLRPRRRHDPRRPTPAELIAARQAHLRAAWDAAVALGCRPYPRLGDEAAWERYEALLDGIAAEMAE